MAAGNDRGMLILYEDAMYLSQKPVRVLLLSDRIYRCPEEKQQVIAFLKEKIAPETCKVMEHEPD